MQTGTILIVDDNKSVLTSLELLLEREFEKIETVSDPNKIFSILDEFIIDLVILDMNFSVGFNTGNEGLFWLQRIHEIRPELPVIMLTAYGDIDLAVKSLKSGAADFVLKPWNNDNLIKKIRTTLQEAKHKLPANSIKGASEPGMIIGHSPAMMKIIKLVTKVAKTDANILIFGENGTGKEVLAREIHRLSLRSQYEMLISIWDLSAKHYLKVNCLDMKKELLQMHTRVELVNLKRQMEVHFFLMKLETYL